MRLVIDMNLSPRWVDALAREGHDATHWSTIGAPDAPDAEVLARAHELGAVLFTNDLDFGAILAASGAAGPSVIQLRNRDIRPQSMIGVLCAALARFEAELRTGALIAIDPAGTRARMLPLRPMIDER